MTSAITYSPAFKDLDFFLRQYGTSSMAFSSLQPELKYFIDKKLGYMAFLYLKDWAWAPKGFNVILGDPICKKEDFDELLDKYLEEVGSENTAFVHLSEEIASKLSNRGVRVNQMGIEHLIDLTSFDVSLPGSHFSHVRRWRNKARKEGVIIKELDFDEVNPSEFQAVNDNWLSRKGGSEYIGLTRPLRVEDKKDVRYFWAFKDERLVGFAFFDPMYRNGEIYGYIHNIARLDDTCPNGTNDLIILTALEKMKEENLEVLSLGLSPLAGIEDENLPCHGVISRILKFMFKHCEFVYPFQGNFFHKEKYRSGKEQTYLAILPDSNLYRLMGVFRTLKVL
jgi:phosphatidylglycerol lysyltransferase